MKGRDVSRKIVKQCLNLMSDFFNSISLSMQYRSFLSSYSLSYPVSLKKFRLKKKLFMPPIRDFCIIIHVGYFPYFCFIC